MRSTDRPVDPLPKEFRSHEEAAEFWDTHSITDYEEFLEPVKQLASEILKQRLTAG